MVRGGRLAVGADRSRMESYSILFHPSLEHSMRTTQQFSITLPLEMAEAVKARVAAGE